MSRFEQRVKDADFEGRAARLRELTESLTPDQRKEAEGQHPDVFERVEAALDLLLATAGLSSGMLVTQRMVNEAITPLDQISAAIEAFKAGQGVAHVGTVDSSLENLLDALSLWPSGLSGEVSEAVTEAASTYRRSAGQQFASLKKDLADAGASLSQLREQHEALGEAIEKAKADFQNKVDQQVQELTTKSQETEAAIAQQKARTDEAISTFQKQFAESQDQRSAAFKEESEQLEAKIETVETSATETIKQLVESIEKQRDRARDIVGVISATGTASAYGKEAKAQEKIANHWRWMAVGFAILASAVAVWGILQAASKDVNIGESLTKIVGTVAFTGIAGYAASQSARHRHREERAKRLELELVVFGPFIEDLDSERKQAAREALVARLFGAPEHDGSRDGAVVTDDTISLLGRLIDVIAKTPK